MHFPFTPRVRRAFLVGGFALGALAAVTAATAGSESVRIRLAGAPFTAGKLATISVTVRPVGVSCRATVHPLGAVGRALPVQRARKGAAHWQIRIPAKAKTGAWLVSVRCGKAGAATLRFTVKPVVSPPPPPPPGDPTIAAAGDIACGPSDTGFNGGKGNGQLCMQAATATLLGGIAGLNAVLPLGDNQYECGETANYAVGFGPTWGRFKAIEHPVVGNHEYGDAIECTKKTDAADYFSYFGPAAGAPGQGWYSYNVGAWHLIALNSNCGFITGGCGAGSPEETWLKTDLASDTAKCTLAYWHHPRFSAGPDVGDDSRTGALWSDLLAAHADLVLVGHDHTYQRFAAMDVNGNATPDGLQQIIVGTGGQEHAAVPIPRPTLLASDNTTFGVLKLTLHPTSYDGQFLPAAGSGTFTDSFSGTCA